MKLYEINRVGEGALYEVVSVEEAAELAFVGKRTIHYHIYAGNLAARKLSRDYAVSLESLRTIYPYITKKLHISA